MLAKRCAVLDIGSNTIRLLIADVHQNQFHKVHYQHFIARLGEGLQQTGTLGLAGQQRAISVFDTVIDICQGFGISPAQVKAVATAAVREASNGKSFVHQVLQTTGLSIQIISGEEEARLALYGAQLVLDKHVSQDMLLFDIGGGSTEFSYVFQGKLQSSISQKLGVVRMQEQFMQQNPTTTKEFAQMKQYAIQHLQAVQASWKMNTTPQYLVGTAGTVTTLAAIAQGMQTYDADRVNNYRLPYQVFAELKTKLLTMTHGERLGIPVLEQGREDVIVAGLAIMDAMFEYWQYQTLVTVDAGLLEGLLLAR